MATLEEVLASVTTLLARYSAALSVDGVSKLLTLNRAGTGDTAAVVLQQGGAERFRMGQIGADTFALQRSPTGAAVNYTDVLSVNRSTGAVTISGGLNAALSGGTINGVTIGGTTPAEGRFTSLTSTSHIVSGPGDATIRILSTDTGVSDDAVLRLQITGTTASNYILFGDGVDGSIGSIRYLHADDSLRISVAGAECARIDSAGRMAIGTTLARAKLNIAGGGSEGYGIEHIAVGVSQPSIINLLATNSSGSASQQAHIVAYQPSGGGASDTALDFRLRGSVGGSFGAPGTIMTLIGDGRVGIGTAPLYRLDVNSGTGDIVARFASSDAGAFIDLRDNVTGAGYVRYGAVGDAAVVWAGNAERVRIDSAGRLLIGTSTSGASKLRVSGLPTTAAGLSAGDIWNDGGTLKVA